MTDSFEISTVIPGVSAEQVCRAWIDSAEHSAFTGSPAEIDQDSEQRYTAWDGYISGRTLEVEPPNRILQSWRTTEFPADSPDSRLEILLEDVDDGVRLTLVHTGIPSGQGQHYRQGWEDYYFQPMRVYFSGVEGSGN
jgi:activator of HSP90 ATPase